MDTFLFSLLAVALLSTGGRDQLLVARLAATLGPNRALLALAMAVSTASAAAMAWAGASIAALLPGPAAQMLIAFALLAAAAELLWPVHFVRPREPTRSLGAVGLVLLVRQLVDAARFAVFALAAASVVAPLAGLGGALGGAVSLALAWTLGEELERLLPLAAIRRVLGLVSLVLAAWIALGARGLI